MIREQQENIVNFIISIGQKIHDLKTIENQDKVDEVIESLGDLKDKIVNL